MPEPTKIEIGGQLVNTGSAHVVTTSYQVMDEATGKRQSQVNQELTSALATLGSDNSGAAATATVLANVTTTDIMTVTSTADTFRLVIDSHGFCVNFQGSGGTYRTVTISNDMTMMGGITPVSTLAEINAGALVSGGNGSSLVGSPATYDFTADQNGHYLCVDLEYMYRSGNNDIASCCPVVSPDAMVVTPGRYLPIAHIYYNSASDRNITLLGQFAVLFGGVPGLSEATPTKSGLMSPEDKAKVDGMAEAIEAAKEQLFIDEWVAACEVAGTGSWALGGYDATADADKRYYIWRNDSPRTKVAFGYADAQKVWATRALPLGGTHAKVNVQAPVNFPNRVFTSSDLPDNKLCTYAAHIPIWVLSNNNSYPNYISGCPYLSDVEELWGKLRPNSNTAGVFSGFANAPKLREIQIYDLDIAQLSFAKSPLLSLASLQYMVENRIASRSSKPIVTVHADVYAKLTDTTNTEWYKVLTDGAAKGITFASA